MLKTFKRGGVHPFDGKVYAKDKAIETPAIPDQVVIPMSMHFGAPCTPTVKVGDHVKKGQLIGTSDAFLHADIHASISGDVVKVAPMPHNTMVQCMAVVIKSDGKDEWADDVLQERDWKQLDSKEIIELIKKPVLLVAAALLSRHMLSLRLINLSIRLLSTLQNVNRI